MNSKELQLQTYPWIGKKTAIGTSIAFVIIVINFYSRVGWTIALPMWALLFLVSSLGFLSGFVVRQVSIDATKKELVVSLVFFGRVLRQNYTDLSKIVWIRARFEPSQELFVIVEGGTRGYETTTILKKPIKSYEQRFDTGALADEIAQALGIESKGYRELT